METLDHASYRVWLHFIPTTLCREKTIRKLNIAFTHADGGNRTWTACAASKYAIHSAIDSWQLVAELT